MYTSIRLGKPRMNCFLFPKSYNLRVGTPWYNPWLFLLPEILTPTPMAQGFPWEEKWRMYCSVWHFFRYILNKCAVSQVSFTPGWSCMSGCVFFFVCFFPTGTNLKSESSLTSDYREKSHLIFEVACGHLTPMISRNSMEHMGNHQETVRHFAGLWSHAVWTRIRVTRWNRCYKWVFEKILQLTPLEKNMYPFWRCQRIETWYISGIPL